MTSGWGGPLRPPPCSDAQVCIGWTPPETGTPAASAGPQGRGLPAPQAAPGAPEASGLPGQGQGQWAASMSRPGAQGTAPACGLQTNGRPRQHLQVQFTHPGLLEPEDRSYRKLAAEEGAHAFLMGIPKAPLPASTSAMLFWPRNLLVLGPLGLPASLSRRARSRGGGAKAGWPGPPRALPLVRARQHHQNPRTLGSRELTPMCTKENSH